MTTAAIRARLAARGITDEPPYGCTWCGDEQHHHGSQWAPIIGLHQWEAPTQAEILERMRRRRANRNAKTDPRARDWDETPAEAARYDRWWGDRDIDYDGSEDS